MLKKRIKYTDYHGNERNEDFYFNLSKAEIATWELTLEGGLDRHVQKITQEQSGAKIIGLFQELIERSYGEKSPDGRMFVKIDDHGVKVVQRFMQTEAYSVLFMELATNADVAAAFVNGIIPEDLLAGLDLEELKEQVGV